MFKCLEVVFIYGCSKVFHGILAGFSSVPHDVSFINITLLGFFPYKQRPRGKSRVTLSARPW